MNQIGKEVPFTAVTFFKWALLAIIVLVILFFILQSLGIISLGIQREVIQHSQQYVETKVNLLNKLHNDYLQLDAEIAELRTGEDNEGIIAAKKAQQKNTINRMKTEADMIPSSQVPTSVKSFLSTHGR